MQVCLYEADEVDLSFRVASEEDLPEVEALGTPEEIATITITCQGQSRTIQRIIPDRYRAAPLAGLGSDQCSTTHLLRDVWLEWMILV